MLLILTILASQIVSADTVAYWRFEDGTNGIKNGSYLDSSANNSTITSYGSTGTNDIPFEIVPVTKATNELAAAFVVTNVTAGEYLSTSGSEWIDTKNFDGAGWTIEAIVKFNDYGTNSINARPGIVCKEGDLGGERQPYFNLQLDPNTKKLRVVTARDSGDRRFINGSTIIELGKWYAIAVTYDRGNEGTDREAELYIKEEADEDYERDGGTSGPWSGIDLNGDLPWTIGRGFRDGAGKGYVSGLIDEVRISDTILDPLQFLAHPISEDPTIPDIKNVQTDPSQYVDENDMVTVLAQIFTENANITNAYIEYSVDGGGYIGPVQMTPTGTPSEFAGDITNQAPWSEVSYRITALNDAGLSSTSTVVYSYTVYEDMDWQVLTITGDAAEGHENLTSMAVAPDDTAGFIYQSGTSSNAFYVEESELGVLKAPVAISGDAQGYFSAIEFGADSEPRATLSFDENEGGVTYVQRTNGLWTSPMVVVSNFFVEYRHALTIAPDQKPSVLWYESDGGPNGELVDITVAGDSFSSAEITVPPFPTIPNGMRKPFDMIVGNDSLRRIVISGPGSSDDQIWLGTETSIQSGDFDWEQVVVSNAYADQIGFVLDDNNYVYIVCRDKDEDPSTASVFENASSTGSSWTKHPLGEQGNDNRSAIAINPIDGSVWVAHNSGIGGKSCYLWSNRSGIWRKEQPFVYNTTLQTYAGFDFTKWGTMKVAYSPYQGIGAYNYAYSTKFGVPEPTLFLIFNFGFWILYVTKRLTSNV